jgi:hypothetical protein
MLDFMMISTRNTKKGVAEIYPRFIVKKSSDLMIRGGDFYAIWLNERGAWSTSEYDAMQAIDNELDIFYKENKDRFELPARVLHLWDAETGMIDQWHKYCQKQQRDSYHVLDENLIFSNTPTKKEDYSSKRLSYPLEAGPKDSYDRLMSVLYSEEERHKIEWAIGSVVTGDSKKIQKFLVFYGAAGTGKSTVLNIIQQLFDGYYSVFDARALGSSSNSFALEAFKSNPLVAIQHDGDLSHIEDNTRLNSLVSHELMTVNEKFKSTYANRFNSMLFMGTNKPVKITDARSGLIRRLIDISPTGNKLSAREYKTLVKKIPFELGAIATHCRDVYLENPGYYDDYIPMAMLGASNDFYNYVLDSYYIFKKEDGVTLKAAWEMYKTYNDEAKVVYPLPQRIFKEELKNYFKEYCDRCTLGDGSRARSYFKGFKTDKFEPIDTDNNDQNELIEDPFLIFSENGNKTFDKMAADYPAQYGTDSGIPAKKWEKVTTTLKDIDISKVHYVRVPVNHIVIDFDIPDENGNKCFQKNLEAAKKWPKTYGELSKSGEGIHLHYIYTGENPENLSRVYDDHIEIKIFNGNSSLRRRFTKCNGLPIATINSGLPMKGEKMINSDVVQTEKGLRTTIKKCLNKEVHQGTKPNIDWIYEILEKAYASDLVYDVTDLRNSVLAFAANSTHQSDYCIKLVNKMHFKSKEEKDSAAADKQQIVFYDVEVFPNLFLVNWKLQGEGKPIIRMINPGPTEIEELMRFNLVGFNCRRYDNHILYARLMGYSNEQLYNLSNRIINGSANSMFGEAYNVSYTDIYDFCSKKQSLKKWEIELGIHHQELGLPWDQPVPEELWPKVAEYCDNDVISTEAVFNARQADFLARKILADVAGMTVNDTTNSLTTRIIFGKERKPQDQFNYRNMGDIKDALPWYTTEFERVCDPEYTRFDSKHRPIFPGYKFESGVSTYRGEEVGEGGYVYAEPGIHTNVALLDIASMHPSSIINEQLFGKEYTKRFQDIRDARIAIKHKDFEKAKTMLDGKLAKYLDDPAKAKELAQALKIAINSVYGLTSASFDNPFRDNRNKDNIVAKRGALFMINLKYEVQKRGYTVAHIKTDSIKIPNADKDIIDFVMEYGKLYGYTFEHEATYDRMCLVNDAVYIAKYSDGDHEFELPTGEKVLTPWTATGTQFQIPYVFKTLFAKKPILFADLCETKSVSTALYLREEAKDPNNPVFVGRVGSFCPIKPGCGGSELLRESKDRDGNVKYSSATGAKGYFWLESEMVKTLQKEKDIDKTYYKKLADEAISAINQYGNFEMFVSDDPYIIDN